LRDEKRANGPQGFIGFAVSACMNPVLREEIAAIPAKNWQPYGEDSSAVKHLAVGTNLWDWKPKRRLKWHRGKAGTIEAVHDVVKNELAGGVLPCGRYGANPAWFLLAVIACKVLTTMKRLVLPPDMQTARPKRLRFLIFQQPGKLIHQDISALP
jgi:hypothetical protein